VPAQDRCLPAGDGAGEPFELVDVARVAVLIEDGEVNNLVKRIKRVASGMRRFRNYRIRALLYAERPNRTLLDTRTPP
jgi:hypothetical protein